MHKKKIQRMGSNAEIDDEDGMGERYVSRLARSVEGSGNIDRVAIGEPKT